MPRRLASRGTTHALRGVPWVGPPLASPAASLSRSRRLPCVPVLVPVAPALQLGLPSRMVAGHPRTSCGTRIRPLTAAAQRRYLSKRAGETAAPPNSALAASSVDSELAAAQRITWIGAGVNLGAAGAKAAAGVAANSPALVADAAHSLSDLLSDGVPLYYSSNNIHSQQERNGRDFLLGRTSPGARRSRGRSATYTHVHNP